MPDDVVRRWSRRIVHPRLTLNTTDLGATMESLEAALGDRGFRTSPAGEGFRAGRRPWLDWLSAVASASCVLLVEPTSPTTVVVDVEGRGSHPAPDRAAEALTRAMADLRARGVEVTWGGWEAVP